jgi:hypothetical protein
MTRVVIVAQVENAQKWEKQFRTHGDLFRRQPGASPYLIGTLGDNEVAVSAEVDDVEAYLETLQSQETADAMANDGVKRDTVRVFVLDREFSF